MICELVVNLEEEDETNPIVIQWLKKTGDTIVQDEVVVTLEAEEWFRSAVASLRIS